MLLLQGMVETLLLDEGELISAGLDGYIRVSISKHMPHLLPPPLLLDMGL